MSGRRAKRAKSRVFSAFDLMFDLKKLDKSSIRVMTNDEKMLKCSVFEGLWGTKLRRKRNGQIKTNVFLCVLSIYM